MTVPHSIDSRLFKPELGQFDDRLVRQDTAARTPSFCATTDVVKLGGDGIAYLGSLARNSDANSVRVCLHESPDDGFHQMIIVQKKGYYYRPHKHLHKCEAYHMIEGELLVFIFDDQGTVVESSQLGSPASGHPFIYRIGVNRWHCTLPLTDQVIFHEMKPGPFVPVGDSIYPDWAPETKDNDAGIRYLESCCQSVQAGLSNRPPGCEDGSVEHFD